MTDQTKAPSTDWSDELAELALRRQQAEAMGGEAAVAKHHAQGRLTIRERVQGLVDAGSFQEIGKLTGQGKYENNKLVKVTPAPYIMGLAKIDGRAVALGGRLPDPDDRSAPDLGRPASLLRGAHACEGS